MMKTKPLYLIMAALLSALVLSACSVAVRRPEPAPTQAAQATPAAATPAAPAKDPLTGSTWQWVSYSGPVEQFDIETPERYTVAFDEQGNVSIGADCNRVAGVYTRTDHTLSIKPGPSTLAACPPGSRGEQFTKLLGAAAIYSVTEGQGAESKLQIDLFADGGTLVFAPAAAAADSAARTAATPATSAAAAGSQAALVATLGNLAYTGIMPDKAISLTDGTGAYKDEGPGTPFVSLQPLVATGDLNGDGADDAVVLLVDHSTGSGVFTFAAAVMNAATHPTPTPALMIGDRIQVKSLGIQNGKVVAELVAQGPNDPACCPSWNVRKQFALQDGALVETGSEDLERVGVADLDGTSWRLVEMGEGQPALLPDAPITLTVAGGQVSGFAGCNTYSGPIADGGGEMAQLLKLGPLVTTRKSCPEAVLAQEANYLKLLGSVAGWRYDAGNLVLAYPTAGGNYGYLRFAPATEQPGAPGAPGATGSGDAAATLPRFEPVDHCFVEPPADLKLKLAIDCGYVIVPEFYQGASTRDLKLGITRISSGKGTGASPLFMLAGGPGQTEIQPDLYRLFQPELLGKVLDARDIVIVEQRGTKYTDTLLDCPAVYSAPWQAYEQKLDAAQTEALGAKIVQECSDGFRAQGINLDAYNSVENAADVNAVRQALGYDRVIFYGASYGAQLGQHVMRDFPQILEGVVLDGANALSRKSWVEDRALDAQWGIDNLTKLCNADAKCRAAYDIPKLVDGALALFDKGPLAYTYTDPSDPNVKVDVTVTQEDLVNLIYALQGDRIGAFSLPALLDQLTQGGADAVRELLGQQKAQSLLAARTRAQGGEAFLMHLAMVCSDDPVKSLDDVLLDGVGKYATIFGQGSAKQYAALCAQLHVKELPDATDVNVTAPVPTLLLSGDLDVQTPAFRSQQVADALPNATHVIFRGRTHVQIAGVNLCAAQVATQFILNPTAPLDTRCAQESPVLGFVLPDGSMSR